MEHLQPDYLEKVLGSCLKVLLLQLSATFNASPDYTTFVAACFFFGNAVASYLSGEIGIAYSCCRDL